jgi:ZIP family zinc transporter
MSAIINAFLLSLVASLGTGLGGGLAILRTPGKRSFGFLMGLTGGVMISLSFLELVNKAWALKGFWTASIGFGAGAFFMLAIDILVPHIRFGELETKSKEIPEDQESAKLSHPGRNWFRRAQVIGRISDPRLFKTGLLLAIGITIHNLPEGIAVGPGTC